MKKLGVKDFKQFTYSLNYYVFCEGDLTISIEPCTMGFDVQIALKDVPIHPTVCTNEEGYEWTSFVNNPPKTPSKETLEYAWYIASELYFRFKTGRIPAKESQ